MSSRSILTYSSLAILAALVTSCSSEPAPTATTEPSASPAATGSPQSKVNSIFKDALLPPSAPQQVPGLISGTSPGQRSAAIVKGRNNPFSPTDNGRFEVIIKQAQVVPPVPPVPGSRSILGLPPGLGNGSNPAIAAKPNQPKPALAAKPPATKSVEQSPRVAIAPRLPLPQLDPPSSQGMAPAVPVPPATELAEAIQVTGVVELGSTLTAIVKSPSEATSRTVRVGDSLEGGQVIVRRIEMRGNQQPQITFSQNGVEITRSVSGAA